MGDDDLLEQMLEEAAAKGPADQKAILKALGEDEPEEDPKDDKVSAEAIELLENGFKEDEGKADVPQAVTDVMNQVGQAASDALNAVEQAASDTLNKLGPQLSGLGEISYVKLQTY
jgi:hypothetical protein